MADWRDRITERLHEREAAQAAREAAALRMRRQADLPVPGSSRMEAVAGFLAPQEPWEYAMLAAGPGARLASKIPSAVRAGLLGAGLAGTSSEAEARTKLVKELGEAIVGGKGKAVRRSEVADPLAAARPYVTDPQRVLKPGIYKDPRDIAREAAARVAPEHPAMKELFGVTRDDLYEISQGGARKGNEAPNIWQPGKPGAGNYAALNIMNDANAQRLIDTLTEAKKYPALERGMVPWYVMDPMFQQMERLVGRERAIAEYKKFNAIVPPFSASSDVMTELNRGTAANMMVTRGEYEKFARNAGEPEFRRGPDFPPELRAVKGHAYHGVQSPPVERWLATGKHGYDPNTVKIPLYSQATGVPQTGFQTSMPIPDAHFTRAVAMSDARKTASPGDYMSGSELRTFGPWFGENVAKPMGIEAVPAQAFAWGAYAPQTGVKTTIGAPKLELLSQRIWDRAKDLGVDPKKLRDDVLLGKEHAVLPLMGAGGLGAGAMGEFAAPDRYQQ